jgi:Uncharacterised nucleotidyltransferase
VHLSDRTSHLLKACLRSGKRAEEAYAAWRIYATPADLSGRELRLMPYLLESLEASGFRDDRTAWIAGYTKYTWVANTLRLPQLLAGVRRLNSCGLQFSLMKGAALWARWPESTARREMGDWDILVARQDARWCLYQLQKIGWKSALPEYLTDADLDRFHALAMGGSHRSELDVHWRPAEIIRDERYTAEVMNRSVPSELCGASVPIVGLTDHLFILFAHAFNDTVGDRADWVAQAAMLFRRSRPEDWDWPLFGRLGRRYRLQSWIEQCLTMVAGLSDSTLPRQAFPRPVAGWARPLQNREIARRGGEARTVLDKSARLTGILARGASPVGIAIHHNRPARALLASELTKALRTGVLTPVRPEGIDLGRVPMGTSFLHGWSIPEAAGRWTDGPRALIALDAQNFAAGEQISLCLDFHADTNRNLEFDCWAGATKSRWSFAFGNPATDQLVLDGKIIEVSGQRILPIMLSFHGLWDVGTRRLREKEARALGIFLRRLTFAPKRYIRTLEKPIHANTPIANAVTFDGWSYPESTGRWSIGHRCAIQFRLPFRRLNSIGLDIPQYFSPKGEPMSLTFYSGGQRLGLVELPAGKSPIAEGGYVRIELPRDAQAGDRLTIEITTGADLSPQQIGLSEDPRQLGFYLSRLDPIS